MLGSRRDRRESDRRRAALVQSTENPCPESPAFCGETPPMYVNVCRDFTVFGHRPWDAVVLDYLRLLRWN
jgi:hypothetical protein